MKRTRRQMLAMMFGGLVGGGAGAASTTIEPGKDAQNAENTKRNAVMGAFLGAGAVAMVQGAPKGEFTPDMEETEAGRRGKWQERAGCRAVLNGKSASAKGMNRLYLPGLCTIILSP